MSSSEPTTADVPPQEEAQPPTPPPSSPTPSPDVPKEESEAQVNVATKSPQPSTEIKGPCKRGQTKKNKATKKVPENTASKQPNTAQAEKSAEAEKSTDAETLEKTAENTKAENTKAENSAEAEKTEDDKISPEETAKGSGEKVPIQQEGDPSKPHLLRIGEKGFAEYIELKPGGLLSRGSFNALGTGYAQSELPKLYNVRTPEQYKAMQTAFAVSSRTAKSLPVYDFIQRKCKFTGYDLVIEALKVRHQTLQTSIDVLQSSDPTKALVNKQRLKWITQLLKDLEPLATAKECPVSGKKNEPAPAPATSSCIGDLNLLRDLIFLLALLHGNADPVVKKQLDSIPLKKLLNTAKKNNINETKPLLVQAIAILTEALQTAKENKVSEIPTDVLKIIFKAIAPEEPIPAELTTEIILMKIQKIKDTITSGVESVKELENTKAKIMETEKELADAQAKLEDYGNQVSSTLSGKDTLLAEKDKMIADTLTKLKDTLSQIEALKARILELETLLNDEKAALAASTASLAEKDQTIATKDGLLESTAQQIDELTTQQKATQETIQAQLDFKTAELDALRIELQAQIDALTKEKSKLEHTSEAKGNTIDQLREKIAILEADISKKDDLLSSTRKEFSDEQDVSEKAKKTIETQEEELAECRKELAETKKQLEEAKTLVTDLQTQIKNLEDSINAYKILVDGKDTEIAELKKSLEEKTNEMGILEKRIIATTEGFEQAKAEVDALESILEALRQTYNDQLNESQAKLTELTTQLGQNEQETARLTAELDSLKENLKETILKANQVDELTDQLNKKGAELSAERTKLSSLEIECREAGEKATAELEELKKQLQTANAAAETLQRQMEEAKEASSADVGKLTDELNTANVKIQSLENELAAKGSAQTEAEKLYAENKEKFEARIAELEKQLEDLRASSAQEKEEAVTEAVQKEQETCKSETEKRDATIADLEGKLETAAAELDIVRNKSRQNIARTQLDASASIESAKADLLSTQEELATLQADLAKAEAERDGLRNEFETYRVTSQEPIAAMEEQISTLTSQKDEEKARANSLEKELEGRPSTNLLASKDERIKALEATITSLQNQISNLISVGEEIDKSHAEQLESLHAELEADFELTSKKDVDVIGEQLKLIEKLGSDMDELERKYSTLRYKDSQSKERLQNLLAMVLIDDELLDSAMKFMDGENIALDSLQEPLCEFYLYLSGLINLQHQKIERSGLPVNAKTDILNIFEKIPYTTNKEGLLKEISSLFQEIFVGVGKTTTIPSELVFKKSYPEINKLFGTSGYRSIQGKPLKPAINITKIVTELGSFGYMSDVGITPADLPAEPGMFKLRKGSLQEFTEENRTYYTPLVILGIKLIQLLEEVLETKYDSLIKKCGLKMSSSERPKTADASAKALEAFEKLELTKGNILQNIISTLRAYNNTKIGDEKRIYYIERLKKLVQWAKSQKEPFNPSQEIKDGLKALRIL